MLYVYMTPNKYMKNKIQGKVYGPKHPRAIREVCVK